MVFLQYMMGALLHVLWRWTGWKGNNHEQSWLSYWRSGPHLAKNIQSLIVSVIVAFVWTQDLVGTAIGLVGTPQLSEFVPTIERTFLSSVTAGFVAEYIGARVVSRLGWGGAK